MPESVEKNQGYNEHGWTKYEIGFELNQGGFIPIIEAFYDNKVPKYIYHKIGREVGIDQTKPPQVLGDQDFRQGLHPM